VKQEASFPSDFKIPLAEHNKEAELAERFLLEVW
jgi:hypothetical protein